MQHTPASFSFQVSGTQFSFVLSEPEPTYDAQVWLSTPDFQAAVDAGLITVSDEPEN
jgi:hypothetical protein